MEDAGIKKVACTSYFKPENADVVPTVYSFHSSARTRMASCQRPTTHVY